MLKKLLLSVTNNVKMYPKLTAGIFIAGVLGLAIYRIKNKQNRKLYQVQKKILKIEKQNNGEKQNNRRSSKILQKYGIKNFQNILIPINEQKVISSANSLSTNQTIVEGLQCQYLHGWHIYSNSKIRDNKRLILYYYSQHTNIQDNLAFIKNLVKSTVSDALIVQYRYQQKDKQSYLYQSQQTMKNDAELIFNKGLQIALKQKKSIVIFGKDLGAMLGIYVCSINNYYNFSSLKGLILQNPFKSLAELRASQINNPVLSKYALNYYNLILKDKWSCKQQIKDIKVPTMLLLRKCPSMNQSLTLYSQFPGSKIIHEIVTKQIKNRNVQNFTDLFMDIDIFLNRIV